MSILLEQLTKRYDGHPVVNNVSLEVQDGEFFVLLGSSGSGKTTVLSMIAGLISMDGGRILLHGRDVTHLPTQERRVGFVFQNYALFEHMSVGDNIEFGLRIRKMPPASPDFGRATAASGLARALAHQPEVLLGDYPQVKS